MTLAVLERFEKVLKEGRFYGRDKSNKCSFVSLAHLQLTYDLRNAEIERGEAIRAQVQRIAHCA
jgi:hypothetical protein